MRDIRITLLIGSFFLMVSCSSQNASTGKQKNRNSEHTNSSCLELLETYSKYWVADSVGKNGFRYLFGTNFLNKCDWKNLKWSEVKGYMGSPNSSVPSDGIIMIRYKLTESNDWTLPGLRILEVHVEGDRIIYFYVRQIDG
jgi:hypothetical protein